MARLFIKIAHVRLGTLLLIALIATVSWAFIFAPAPTSDAQIYYLNAISISQGNGYDPDAYWPVGYSLFLGTSFAVLEPTLFIARVLNAVLYIGIVGLTYKLANFWTNTPQVAATSAWFMLIYAGFFVYISLTMSEICFTFFLLLGLVLMHLSVQEIRSIKSYSMIFAAGIAFGAGTLIRPQVIAIPLIVMLCYLHLRSQNIRKTITALLVLYGGIIASILPWFLHTYNSFDRIVFVSNNGGINLFMGNNPYADGSYMEDTVEKAIIEMGYKLSETLNASERDALYQSAAIDYARSYPLEVVARIPAKLFFYFRDEVSGWLLFPDGPVKLLGMIVSQVIYMGSMSFSILGLYLSRKRLRNSDLIIPISVSLYFALIAVVFFGSSRFRLPSMPFLIMFSAVAVARILKLYPGVSRIVPSDNTLEKY